MGFRDMKLFNQALLARQAWRLLAFPDSLCGRVLKAKYYPNGELIDTVFTGNPSSTWTAISFGLELLKKGMIWWVDNGKKIRVWRDSWIPRTTYHKALTSRPNRRIQRVADLLDQTGAWKEDLVCSNFDPIDAEAILSIKTSRRLDADILAWHPEPSGIFSVRSAYKLAMGETPANCGFAATSGTPAGDNPIWKRIWSADVPPKVKNFAWKAANNSLATEDNKLIRHFGVTGLCNICKSELEDVAHALYKCPHAFGLWEAVDFTGARRSPSEPNFMVSVSYPHHSCPYD
jgi:hypothetical protein